MQRNTVRCDGTRRCGTIACHIVYVLIVFRIVATLAQVTLGARFSGFSFITSRMRWRFVSVAPHPAFVIPSRSAIGTYISVDKGLHGTIDGVRNASTWSSIHGSIVGFARKADDESDVIRIVSSSLTGMMRHSDTHAHWEIEGLHWHLCDLPPLVTCRHQMSLALTHDGGYIDLTCTGPDSTMKHVWRLYVAIAEPVPSIPENGYPLADRLLALAMGTHARLGANSCIKKISSSTVQLISSFLTMDWKKLERQLTLEDLSNSTGMSTEALVAQYRLFLRLKIETQDWRSDIVCPSPHPRHGPRLVDKIWHAHLAMPGYSDDCIQLAGRVISHVPIVDCDNRYKLTWCLYASLCLEIGQDANDLCWPDPFLPVQVSSSSDDGSDPGVCG